MTDHGQNRPPEPYQLLYDAAMLAGTITLESGAEIFRVEDTMRRIMGLSGLPSVEVFATSAASARSTRFPGSFAPGRYRRRRPSAAWRRYVPFRPIPKDG